MPPEDVDVRLGRIELEIQDIGRRLATLEGQNNTMLMLVKWVVFPLLVIVAALVGVKLVLPG